MAYLLRVENEYSDEDSILWQAVEFYNNKKLNTDVWKIAVFYMKFCTGMNEICYINNNKNLTYENSFLKKNLLKRMVQAEFHIRK